MADDRGAEALKIVPLVLALFGLVVKGVKSLVAFVRRVDRIEAAQAGMVRDEALAPQLASIRQALREAQIHAEHDGALVAGELGAIEKSMGALELRVEALERPRRRRR